MNAPRKFAQKPVPLGATNALMVPGIASSEEAKMIGRTPDMFTLMGMKVDCPPYILRPTTFLAYCTGMRRSAVVMMMISTISARKSTTMSGTVK